MDKARCVQPDPKLRNLSDRDWLDQYDFESVLLALLHFDLEN
jgi:hypothetical protein